MSRVRCIAVFDAGTTAVKTCLFSEKAELLAVSVQEYALDAWEDRVEADPQRYWEAVCRGMAEVLALTPNAHIEAVGLTTQGETLVPVDSAGQPLRPFLVWLDNRAAAQAEMLRTQLKGADFYRTTGLPGIEGALPLAKLRWLKEHEPGIVAQTAKFLLLEDYLLFRLTGRMVTEPSLQTSTGWFRLDMDTYWPEALAAAGISPDKLPELQECGSFAGALSDEAARQLGLHAGTPVFTGAMDQTAAALAAGSGGGVITETTGTALVAAAVTDHPVFSQEHPVTIYRHAVRGQYVCLPIGNTAGMALRWFRDQFCPATPLWTRWPLLSLRVLKGWYFFPIYPAASIRMPARRQEPYFLEPPWPTPVPILPGPYWNPPPLYSLIFWKCWRRWAVPAGNCALWAAARPADYGSKSRQMYAAGSWLFPPAGRPPLRALPYWRGAAAG